MPLADVIGSLKGLSNDNSHRRSLRLFCEIVKTIEATVSAGEKVKGCMALLRVRVGTHPERASRRVRSMAEAA